MRQKSRHMRTHTHKMVTQSRIHKANIFQSVQPWFHQLESQSAVLQSPCLSLSLSLSLSLYVCLSFPPALSLADRSEVADQAGRLSV